MKYSYSVSEIYVLGTLWMPSLPGATTYTLTHSDVQNAKDEDGKLTRESVGLWLDSHAGDFSGVTDFSASLEDDGETIEIPWSSEDNELDWQDMMHGEDWE